MTKVSALLLLLLLVASPLPAEEASLARLIEENSDRVPTVTVVPEYPNDALRDRIEGEVQVCYNVDRKGQPYRVAVRTSTHRIFEKPSKRAVKSSLYVPLEPGEKTSGIKTCRTFRFQLQPLVDDNLLSLNWAARSVFDISMTIVIGPTPPGTGVTAAATDATSS